VPPREGRETGTTLDGKPIPMVNASHANLSGSFREPLITCRRYRLGAARRANSRPCAPGRTWRASWDCARFT